MGHIPADAEWYTALLVMEITVQGALCNILHRNLVLIKAHTPEEAYAKAVENGQKSETQYLNPKNQLVNIRFRGLSQLDVIYEPLVDGAELCFEELLRVSESDIRAMIPEKGKLKAFTPPNPGGDKDPDYRSKAVIKAALKMSSGDRIKKRRKRHKKKRSA